MSHRSFRSTRVPVASGLAAVIAVSWLLGAVPALAAADYGVAGASIQAQEWWLADLHVTQAWQTTEGAGITVAVLGTGVAAGHPDLAGSVSTGPDFTGSGRTAGGPFWGIDGTEVAGVIAGHGHGTGGEAGILGIAPAAKILSIRVSLEYNDPLNSDPAIARRLPAAIAEGITYAVDHGARIIDLPLDPGTAGLTGQGDPAAAGGSQAEQAAVTYALRKNVVLVAPAGDDAQGTGLVNYPAAYPGVIAVGAVARDGQLAPFSSRHSYVSLTAPGVDLMAATPPDDYARISSTSTSSGIVAGVAALILSRYPHLTVAQVTQALTGGTVTDRAGSPGAGHGTVDAARAVEEAAAISSADQPSQPARPRPGRISPRRAVDHGGSPGERQHPGRVAGALRRGRPGRADRAAGGADPGHALPAGAGQGGRAQGSGPGPPGSGPGGCTSTASRSPGPSPATGRRRARRAHRACTVADTAPPPLAGRRLRPGRRLVLAWPRPATTGGWPAAGGWQGGSVGEIAHSSGAPYRPVMTPAPKAAKTAKAAANPRDRPGRPRRSPSARSGRSRWWRTARSRRIRVPASGCPGTWRRCPPWRPTPCRPRPSTSRRRRTRTSRRGPRSVTTRAPSRASPASRTFRPGRASASPRPRSRSTTRRPRPLTSPCRHAPRASS